ncbi:pyrimidine dimer DNA glycosylase/endonuclease V [Tsukamurella spumae]|uniref:DNA lyase n=1 Tax=Tsukamurella spumae TaxID=44753 RepID=A0A846WYL8_9ACTN|nr:pyrimidine dimer DNA glycosylase/endonuclease V [Tsukamurella spumae]NKY17355.1 DNA lyase [Tsukamurella spumae]
MRIWSVHPRYLDRQALVACWRETLLAQAVLAGRTKGYTRHPQLERFRATPEPLDTVGAYLSAIADEADARGYTFDRTRIDAPDAEVAPIDVTTGQLDLEWAHLMAKLTVRNPEVAERWRTVERPDPHRSFRAVPGEVESWERAAPPGA